MTLAAPLDTALSGSAIRIFEAVEIVLPNYTIRVMSGSGTVTFNGMTFTGEDPMVGSLSSISAISESIATEAPRVQVTFMPPTTGGIADIAAVNAQGSPVRIWAGVVSETNGAVIGTELLFTGLLDVTRELVSGNVRYVEADIASVFDRMFVVGEGARWIDAAQQEVWPGDDGLSFIAAAGNFPMWGIESAQPPAPKGFVGGLIGRVLAQQQQNNANGGV